MYAKWRIFFLTSYRKRGKYQYILVFFVALFSFSLLRRGNVVRVLSYCVKRQID